MKPILYEAGTTNFNNNGLGRLSSCISCLVTEERNGVFECEFKYPITGKHYEEIQEGRIITVSHDEQGDRQPFIIYRRSAVLSGVVTFSAHHVSYLLNNIILSPFEASSPAGAFVAIPTHSMGSNPFDFWTDNTTAGGTIAVTVPTAVRAFLGGVKGSFLDLYGGEYEWDGYTVKNYAHRGSNNGVTIRYGKNLTKLEQEIDTLDLYDSVVPFWMKDDVVVFGGIVTGTGQTQNLIRALDLSGYYEEAPTVAQLEARAQTFLDNNQPWLPKENISIDFVALWQTEEYKDIAPLERVQLCDTVTVVYTDLGVQATAKVIEVVWDALLERYNKIELGDAKSSFANTILKTTDERIAEAMVETEGMMNEAIDHATEMITGGLGGYIVINRDANGYPNELLIMDSPNKTTAVNVWRWNSGGLGHSHSGYNGPYNDVAITQDGKINASMITAGTMNANLIRAGILADTQGYNFWNLATGEFKLSWNSTIGNQTIQEVIDGAGGYSLETPFTWSNGGQTANFTAVVYKGTEDVTSTLDPSWFVWTLRTEDGETQVGTGKTLSLNRSQFGYGATVTCTFTTYDDVVALRSVDNKKLKSVDGKQLLMYDNQDEDVLVSDLPLKTAAEVDSTDKLMGIDDVEGYQVSITNFGDFLATSKYDARYVNVTGDTMTGQLVIDGASVGVKTDFEIGVAPSYNGFFHALDIYDTNGTEVGAVYGIYTPSDNLGVQLEVARTVADTRYVNNVRLYINGNGAKSVSVSDPDAWRTALNVVNKSGDTMTGNLVIAKETNTIFMAKNTVNDVTIGQTVPSKNVTLGHFNIADMNDWDTGGVYIVRETSDLLRATFRVRRKNANGTEIVNSLVLGIDSSGARKVIVNESAPWRAAIGAVNKAGDTMTGELIVKYNGGNIRLRHTGITVGTTPSSSVYSPYVSFQDNNGTALATVGAQYITDGKLGAYLQAARMVSGTTIFNKLSLMIDASGNRSVTVSDAKVWRNAIMPVGSIASLASNKVYYRKIGDKVCVWGHGVSCGTSWTDIATLPSGYRPRDRNMYFAGICGSNGNRHMSVGILTSGVIRASSSTAATDGYFYAEFYAP